MPNDNPKKLRIIEQTYFRWTELQSSNNGSTEAVNVPGGVVLRENVYSHNDENGPALSLLFLPGTVLVERFTEETLPADEDDDRKEEKVMVRHIELQWGKNELLNGWHAVGTKPPR